MKYTHILLLVSFLWLSSCNNNNTTTPPTDTTSGTGKVYSVGYLSKQDYYSLPRTAKLWIDATEHSLTDGTKDAKAIAVFLSGEDVYVVGYESNGSKKVAKLWKNSVATNLSDGTKDAEATAVYVSGTDVYVAGFESYRTLLPSGTELTKPVIWKNGIASYLPITDNFIAEASSVSVIGTDVYVAGSESSPNGRDYSGIMWKNGVASIIASNNISSFINCRAMVTTNGSDVYTGCFENIDYKFNFRLQKNGVTISTLPGINLGECEVKSKMAFALNGADVYVAGRTDTGKTVLKNGIEAPSLRGTNMLHYNCIAFSDTDVFIGGMRADNTYIGHATFIKNGVAIILNNNAVRNSDLLGIAVKN